MEVRDGTTGGIWLDSELTRTMRSASDVKQKVGEIVALLQDSLFRYLVRVLDSPSAAEDVMQEAFIRLFRSLHKGQAIDDVRSWIFRVAHNLAIDRFRKKSPVELLDTAGWKLISEHKQDPSPSAERKVLEQEQQERFQAALARLSPQEKHCLELRAEGLSYREIAAVLEMRTPTLVSFLGRIIKKMMRETYD
ncbi:MAG: RNA polymerase sigma factor [Acidobacteria bacterium]|nr:RNA polymerase sigma factor [Acidobacteriota bacterium]